MQVFYQKIQVKLDFGPGPVMFHRVIPLKFSPFIKPLELYWI